MVALLGMALITTIVVGLVVFVKGPKPCVGFDCPCANHDRRKTLEATIVVMVLAFAFLLVALMVAGVTLSFLSPL